MVGGRVGTPAVILDRDRIGVWHGAGAGEHAALVDSGRSDGSLRYSGEPVPAGLPLLLADGDGGTVRDVAVAR
ncbi:MAG: hypothetical protein AVDCRST_MAG39-2118 [uncultured Sphingomonadaceae bacterium]|uniref:Uncharacterized protein n=1 Tax=uncultured Sphingomonadaceae bacterium TaxID=169976 RepID=A0A6J4T3B4_9SPHN|nr:MAG: hypothetical protein AVDCRST_MAG39-2118 [uncultured Sphingomonadaceae bacterium]